VTAVLAVYNGAKWLRRALDSVLAQTHPVECIVIDDGSTDNTGELVRSYGPRVRYIYQENRGVAAARNAGVRHATSEWIGFLDQDDQWLPEKTGQQLAALEAQPAAALCYSSFHWHLRDGGSRTVLPLPPGDLWPLIRLQNPFLASGVLIRKREFLELGGFDEKLKGASCEDWEFFIRFLARYPAIRFPEPVMNYFETEASNSRNHRCMLPNSLSIVEGSLLIGLTGVRRALWRRRIKSVIFYRAAISAREAGERAFGYLWRSLREWPFPDVEPKRLKSLLVWSFRSYLRA